MRMPYPGCEFKRPAGSFPQLSSLLWPKE